MVVDVVHPFGSFDNWGLTVQAICTTPFPGEEVVAASSATDSQAAKR